MKITNLSSKIYEKALNKQMLIVLTGGYTGTNCTASIGTVGEEYECTDKDAQQQQTLQLA
jgi:hypothetical protein